MAGGPISVGQSRTTAIDLANPAKNYVRNGVALAMTYPLVAGHRPCGRPWREALVGIAQQWLGFQNRQHLIGIVCPVGGCVKAPAGDEPGCCDSNDVRADQAALVMPGLRPRIGKECPDPVQRIRRNHLSQQSDPVAVRNSHIFDAVTLAVAKQRNHTRGVDLGGKNAGPRIGERHFDCGVTHSGPDFEYHWYTCAE